MAQQPVLDMPHYATSVFPLGSNLAVADVDCDGRTDILSPRHCMSLGPVVCSFYSMLLDDDGQGPGFTASGPPAGRYSFNGSVRTVAADFDGDGWVDVASLSDAGALTIFLNQHHGPLHEGFSTGVLVEDFAARFAAFPAWLLQSALLAADFDGDGAQDILFAGQVVNSLAGAVVSTGLNVYFGHGDGAFDPVCVYQTPSRATPLDVRWVDWGGVDNPQTLVVLGETHLAPYSVVHSLDLCRFQRNPRAIVPLRQAQQFHLPASGRANVTRPTAVDFVPATATSPRRFVLCGYSTILADNSPELWLADAQIDGTIAAAGFTPLQLPGAMFGAPSSELQAVHVADLDGDGQLDAVALHLQGLQPTGPQLPAELVLVSGPLVPGGNPAIAVRELPGTLGTLLNATSMLSSGPAWIPNTTAPDAIALDSVTRARLPDVFVSGLRVPNPANPAIWIFAVAVLRNLSSSPQNPPFTGIRSVSGCRPLPGGIEARCGIVGGDPVPGNSRFGVSLTRAPASALVALHAGYSYTPLVFPLGPGVGLPFGTVVAEHSRLMAVQAPHDGEGCCVLPVPIPSSPTLLGATAYYCWTIYDRNSTDPVPIYNSDTLRVTVW